jgi:hypothetical protein
MRGQGQTDKFQVVFRAAALSFCASKQAKYPSDNCLPVYNLHTCYIVIVIIIFNEGAFLPVKKTSQIQNC